MTGRGRSGAGKAPSSAPPLPGAPATRSTSMGTLQQDTEAIPKNPGMAKPSGQPEKSGNGGNQSPAASTSSHGSKGSKGSRAYSTSGQSYRGRSNNSPRNTPFPSAKNRSSRSQSIEAFDHLLVLQQQLLESERARQDREEERTIRQANEMAEVRRLVSEVSDLYAASARATPAAPPPPLSAAQGKQPEPANHQVPMTSSASHRVQFHRNVPIQSVESNPISQQPPIFRPYGRQLLDLRITTGDEQPSPALLKLLKVFLSFQDFASHVSVNLTRQFTPE